MRLLNKYVLGGIERIDWNETIATVEEVRCKTAWATPQNRHPIIWLVLFVVVVVVLSSISAVRSALEYLFFNHFSFVVFFLLRCCVYVMLFTLPKIEYYKLYMCHLNFAWSCRLLYKKYIYNRYSYDTDKHGIWHIKLCFLSYCVAGITALPQYLESWWLETVFFMSG